MITLALFLAQTVSDALRIAQTLEEQTAQGHAFIIALVGMVAVALAIFVVRITGRVSSLVQMLDKNMKANAERFDHLIRVTEHTNDLMVHRQVNEATLTTRVNQHERRIEKLEDGKR